MIIAVVVSVLVLIIIIVAIVYFVNKKNPTKLSNLFKNIKTKYSTFNDTELPNGEKIVNKKPDRQDRNDGLNVTNPMFEFEQAVRYLFKKEFNLNSKIFIFKITDDNL